MIQKLKKKLKDQRGMTLIELLAVIVILAIISAIAIPSILGLIDNSKKDAHVANARQMINSAKLAVAGDDEMRPAPSGTVYIPLAYLETKGYMEAVKDPDGGNYATGSATIATASAPTSGSFVKVEANSTGKLSYSVYLINDKSTPRKIGTDKDNPKAENDLKRSSVLN